MKNGESPYVFKEGYYTQNLTIRTKYDNERMMELTICKNRVCASSKHSICLTKLGEIDRPEIMYRSIDDHACIWQVGRRVLLIAAAH